MKTDRNISDMNWRLRVDGRDKHLRDLTRSVSFICCILSYPVETRIRYMTGQQRSLLLGAEKTVLESLGRRRPDSEFHIPSDDKMSSHDAILDGELWGLRCTRF